MSAAAQPAPVVWCIGLYASASTWMFNLVRNMAVASQPPGGVTPHFCAGAYDPAPLDPPGLHIIKTHEVRDVATAEMFGRRAAHILITVRDPRDAVASMMTYQGHRFEHALAHATEALRLCVRFAADPRARLFYYESGFHADPATAHAIAAHLGFALPAAQIDRVFDGLRRARVEAYIATMPGRTGILREPTSGDLLDPQTHWHSHHSGRSGESGRWRRILSTAQAARVTETLGALYRFPDKS